VKLTDLRARSALVLVTQIDSRRSGSVRCADGGRGLHVEVGPEITDIWPQQDEPGRRPLDGEVSTTLHRSFTIDGTAPVVTSISPSEPSMRL
jgi:hypothetical protein